MAFVLALPLIGFRTFNGNEGLDWNFRWGYFVDRSDSSFYWESNLNPMASYPFWCRRKILVKKNKEFEPQEAHSLLRYLNWSSVYSTFYARG